METPLQPVVIHGSLKRKITVVMFLQIKVQRAEQDERQIFCIKKKKKQPSNSSLKEGCVSFMKFFTLVA